MLKAHAPGVFNGILKLQGIAIKPVVYVVTTRPYYLELSQAG